MATATAKTSLKRMYIDGKWIAAGNGRTLGVTNPATEEVIEEIAYGGRAEARQALEAADRAMPSWMKLTAWDRGKILKKTADLMRERLDAIARTLTMEQGKPLPEAKAEILHSADTFEWFAEEGKRAYGQVIPNSQPGKRHVEADVERCTVGERIGDCPGPRADLCGVHAAGDEGGVRG